MRADPLSMIPDVHRWDVSQYYGLPTRSMNIRNSGRAAATCPRKWLFSKGEELEPEKTGRAFSYGNAWHLLMQDANHFWMRNPLMKWRPKQSDPCPACSGRNPTCHVCDGSGVCALQRIRSQWMHDPDLMDDFDTLTRNLTLYLDVNNGFLSGLRVVDVEVPLSMPVFTEAGRVFRTKVFVLVDQAGNWRRARRGEALKRPPGTTLRFVNLPIWVTSILDAVYHNKGMNCLLVGEHKSTADIKRYLRTWSVDPQVTLYEMVLEYALSMGWSPTVDALPRLNIGNTSKVGGWLLQITSSRPLRDPFILKSGRISTAKGKLASVTSKSLSEAMILTGQEGDPRMVQQIMEQVARVDNARVQSEIGSSNLDMKKRVQRELLAYAKSEAVRWRASALLRTEAEADEQFPRIPVCRYALGSCPYMSPCSFDDKSYSRVGLVSHEPLQLGSQTLSQKPF